MVWLNGKPIASYLGGIKFESSLHLFLLCTKYYQAFGPNILKAPCTAINRPDRSVRFASVWSGPVRIPSRLLVTGRSSIVGHGSHLAACRSLHAHRLRRRLPPASIGQNFYKQLSHTHSSNQLSSSHLELSMLHT